MIKNSRLKDFADKLIKRKRFMRSVQYLLIINFFSLLAGIILALPLRYFLGLTVGIPLTALIIILFLSFIYGFLGIEKSLDILKETDLKMSLNEKLSAAYQFGESENPYSILLINEAENIINNLDVRNVFQIKLSRRDPFQLLFIALFFFLWMSSFSFLQIGENSIITGDMLIEASQKIEAVNSANKDKELEELAEEYRKLGLKIQDQFMQDQSIKRKVDKLNDKLERIKEDLSREGVDKENQFFNEEEESEIFQLNRKKKMSDDLNEILKSLMKTFSISTEQIPATRRKGDGESSTEANEQSYFREEKFVKGSNDTTENDSREESDPTATDRTSEIEKSDRDDSQKDLNKGKNNNPESESTDGVKDDSAAGTEQHNFSQSEDIEKEMPSKETPGSNRTDETTEYTFLREEKESGEFDEENIRGELQEGEQMKSFIRAFPKIVEPTLKELEVLHYYKNQLKNAVDKEILPESYQTIVRDYFLSIGVLNE